MALEFAICTLCAERHAVQRNGKVSIHTNAAGERCDGVDVEAEAAAAEDHRMAIEQRKSAAHARKVATDLERMRRENATADLKDSDRLAREEAYAVAAAGRKGRDPGAPSTLDRRIYATKGAYPVSGGLPTLGRGR